MLKNTFKAIIFQLSKNNQSDLRSEQFVQFIKSLHHKAIKIGFILPEQAEHSTGENIDPLIQAVKSLKVFPSETIIFLSKPGLIKIARNNGFGLIASWQSNSEKNKKFFNDGADILIKQLNLLDPKWIDDWFSRHPAHILENKSAFTKSFGEPLLNPYYLQTGPQIMQKKGKPVFFLDYDGTLTPIVQRPEMAILDSKMKNLLIQLSKKYHVALVSGRDKTDLMKLVGIPDIFYAGSHGMDIHGPDTSMVFPTIEKYLPVIDIITDDLEKSLYHFPGVILEKKKLSAAVHYRMMQSKHLPELKKILKRVLAGRLNFIRILKGKKVIEFLPNIEWNKGKAIVWIINVLDISWNKHRIFCLGDDTTDEDAFRIVRTRGTGILISEKARISAADFRLHSINEVEEWLKSFLN